MAYLNPRVSSSEPSLQSKFDAIAERLPRMTRSEVHDALGEPQPGMAWIAANDGTFATAWMGPADSGGFFGVRVYYASPRENSYVICGVDDNSFHGNLQEYLQHRAAPQSGRGVLDIGALQDGRRLKYDQDTQAFVLDGGNIPALDIAALDLGGALTWVSDDMRTWVWMYKPLVEQNPKQASGPLFQRIRDFLDSSRLEHSETSVGASSWRVFAVSLLGMNDTYFSLLYVHEGNQVVKLRILLEQPLPLGELMELPKDTLDEVVRFVTQANFGLSTSAFELDLVEGEIVCRGGFDSEGTLPGDKMLKNLIGTTLSTADRYYPGLRSVMNGAATAKEAISRIES